MSNPLKRLHLNATHTAPHRLNVVCQLHTLQSAEKTKNGDAKIIIFFITLFAQFVAKAQKSRQLQAAILLAIFSSHCQGVRMPKNVKQTRRISAIVGERRQLVDALQACRRRLFAGCGGRRRRDEWTRRERCGGHEIDGDGDDADDRESRIHRFFVGLIFCLATTSEWRRVDDGAQARAKRSARRSGRRSFACAKQAEKIKGGRGAQKNTKCVY